MARKEERRFQYQDRSRADVQARANMKGGNFDSIFVSTFKQWKPKEGKNRIRILPSTWKGAKHYGLDVYVNYSIGPDKQAYLSLAKHDKGPDPLEEARREALKEGDKEFARQLSPSHRILYWIIDRADEDEGPLLWAAPMTFDKSLANLTIDEDTKDVIKLDHHEEGQDVRFYREGTGLATSYDASKMKLMGAAPISEDEGLMNEWLDFVYDNPLPDVLNFYDYDHIKAQFDGQAGRDDEREDNEKAKAKAKPKASTGDDDEAPARASRKAPVDDDDEDDVKPAPRSARTQVKDDDDEQDEDEAPPPRSARRKAEEDTDNERPARRSSRSRVSDDEELVTGDADDDDDDGDDDVRPTSSLRGRSDNGTGERRSSLRDKLAARRRSLNG